MFLTTVWIKPLSCLSNPNLILKVICSANNLDNYGSNVDVLMVLAPLSPAGLHGHKEWGV